MVRWRFPWQIGGMDWDLSDFFPSLTDPSFRTAFEGLQADAASLLEDMRGWPELTEEEPADWVEGLQRYETLSAQRSHLSSFVSCHRAADGTNPVARRADADRAKLGATFSKLRTELVRGIGRATPPAREALLSVQGMGELAYRVERLAREASRTMDVAREGLAADLAVDGLHAWGRLYDSVASGLDFEMVWPEGGERERVPMAQRRALLRHADRRVRKAAFVGGNAAWASVRDVLASALNAISGTRLTLYQHRGVSHFLDVALDDGAISAASLEAMFAAIEEEAELPRTFLRRKASLLGREAVAWYDLEGPLVRDGGPPMVCGDIEAASPTWETAVEMVRGAFGAAYPALQAFFERAIERRWVDHTPRPGKQPGAWCTSSPVIQQSRVFMTYAASMSDVSTLAHEIGHGFHAHTMRDVRPLLRSYPMTLAESASTFAELILNESLLRDERLSDGQRAALLGAALGDAAIFLLDITTRFRFERALYQRRASGELSADELGALMVQTQREVFGDALDPDGVDPLFWASKLHFFITSVSFYNFPYAFGYLLSRGMRAMHAREGEAFLPRYERFLQRSGSDWAHRVAKETLGVDLEQPDFWRDAIRSLAGPLEQLETLTAPAA